MAGRGQRLLALNGHGRTSAVCPLSEVKRHDMGIAGCPDLTWHCSEGRKEQPDGRPCSVDLYQAGVLFQINALSDLGDLIKNSFAIGARA